jgi:hypothetical protein
VAHRTKKGHFLKGPPKQRALGIAEVVTLQFAATCTYTFLIIAAAGHPNSLTGQLLKGGIVATGQVLGLLFGSPLHSDVSTQVPEGVAAYRHVLFVCVSVIAITIRRECVDHFVVLGEAHLHRILRAYARYYNDIRTHRSLDKDAPVSRRVQRTGIISSHAILGGLHHHYVRV